MSIGQRIISREHMDQYVLETREQVFVLITSATNVFRGSPFIYVWIPNTSYLLTASLDRLLAGWNDDRES